MGSSPYAGSWPSRPLTLPTVSAQLRAIAQVQATSTHSGANASPTTPSHCAHASDGLDVAPLERVHILDEK